MLSLLLVGMPFHRRFFAGTVILAILAIVISGCAFNIPQPATEKTAHTLWQQQKLNNSSISSWQLSGKIGVKTGNKGGSATLKWAYQSSYQEIQLYGPFGGGRVKISLTNDSAILRDTKGTLIEGETAEQVLYQHLGWQVPFSELIMWCRGLPGVSGDDASDIVIDRFGRLKSFKQGGWQVDYQEYRSVNDLTLPRKFTITSLPGAIALYDEHGKYIGDQLNVKVILKRWAINQPDS